MSKKTKAIAEVRVAERLKKQKRNRILAAAASVVVLGGIAFGYSAIVNTLPEPKAAATWDTKKVNPTDVAYGDPKAPARITEYGSLTCHHCANFHENAFSQFKKNFIDTGKVYFVYSHFPYDNPSLQAASAISCLPKDKRPDAIMRLYETQAEWAFEADAGSAAVSQLDLDDASKLSTASCVAEGKNKDGISQIALNATRNGIASTPTFVVNGSVYEGFMSSDVLGAIALEETAAK